MIVVDSAYGFNSAADYQSTGAWAAQYITNGYNAGVNTEFHEDTVNITTLDPIGTTPAPTRTSLPTATYVHWRSDAHAFAYSDF
jgi:hypothetical protein